MDIEPGGGKSEGVGTFYKAVAQVVLLFRAETWVITPRMEQALDSCKNRITRRITGRQPMRRRGESWAYPTLDEAMGKAGLEGIRKSVTRRKNTVAQYIEMRPILDLCEQSTRRPVARVSRQWQWR